MLLLVMFGTVWSFFLKNLLFYFYGCFAYVSVYTPHMCLVSEAPGLELQLVESCHFVGWESNPGLLEEQTFLLANKPTLKHQVRDLFKTFKIINLKICKELPC